MPRTNPGRSKAWGTGESRGLTPAFLPTLPSTRCALLEWFPSRFGGRSTATIQPTAAEWSELEPRLIDRRNDTFVDGYSATHGERWKIIAEIPVRWENDPESRVHMILDSLRMILEVVKIRWRFLRA